MEIARQKEFPANYSQEVLDILDEMSMTDLKGMRIAGSASIRSQQYSGDYDAFETVKASSVESVKDKLQDIVKGLRMRKGVYIGDIKCGEVAEWNVFDSTARVVDGKIENFNIKSSQSKVDALREEGVLTKKEADDANARLAKATTPFGFLSARKEIRFHVLRWKPADILEGAMVYRDKVFKLEDAIESGGMVKIDTIANISDRFTEFSVIYDILIKGKRVTATLPKVGIALQEDIAYYSKTNPFKALKRTFSLAKVSKDTETLKHLLPILNSDLGRLSQIIGDMGTIVELLGRPSIPTKTLRESIDEFRSRLGSIYELNDVLRAEHDIIGTLYAILKTSSAAAMKRKLETIKDKLQGILDRNTLKMMNS